MKLRIPILAAASVTAFAAAAAVLIPGVAQAQAAPGHVILKAGGGTIALATEISVRGLPPSGGRGIALPVSFLDEDDEHAVD